MAVAADAGIDAERRFRLRERGLDVEHGLEARLGGEAARQRRLASDIEEHRFPLSLKHDVEAIAVRAVAPRDERRAPCLGHEREHRVVGFAGSSSKYIRVTSRVSTPRASTLTTQVRRLQARRPVPARGPASPS